MFKFIQRTVERMFSRASVETTSLLLAEADMLMKSIKKASTLAELLKIKAVLQKFRGAVEFAGSPQVVKNKLIFLEAQWNKRFRIWKTNG